MSALPPSRVGPGLLVLVVGPSGAGKDTLMDGARRELAGRADVVFPARLITRAPHESEAFVSVSEEAFAAQHAAGRFALAWQAHGLSYGVPVLIDDALRAGVTVVLNVSRMVIAAARARYARVCVVLVDAPPEELARRIAGRGRETQEDAGQRLLAAPWVAPAGVVDIRIENMGAPQTGIRTLVDVILGWEAPVLPGEGQAGL
jgi:ribose 1,5-bisphosphokinase